MGRFGLNRALMSVGGKLDGTLCSKRGNANPGLALYSICHSIGLHLTNIVIRALFCEFKV